MYRYPGYSHRLVSTAGVKIDGVRQSYIFLSLCVPWYRSILVIHHKADVRLWVVLDCHMILLADWAYALTYCRYDYRYWFSLSHSLVVKLGIVGCSWYTVLDVVYGGYAYCAINQFRGTVLGGNVHLICTIVAIIAIFGGNEIVIALLYVHGRTDTIVIFGIVGIELVESTYHIACVINSDNVNGIGYFNRVLLQLCFDILHRLCVYLHYRISEIYVVGNVETIITEQLSTAIF